MAPSGRRRPNSKLRAKRDEHGLTQDELADELSRLRWQTDPDAPPITSGMVSRWERGQRPHQHHRRLLCEFFGLGQDGLGLRPPASVGADGDEAGRDGYDGSAGASPTKRRTVLFGAAGAFAALAGAPLADPLLTALNRLSHLAGSSIGAAVDGFEALVADLGLNYSREPAARLFTRLDGLLEIVQGIIDSEAPKTYRRRLHSIAGWSAGLLANALYDLGDSAAANVNAALALEYGRQAGDARLQAWVRNRQAMFAESGEQPLMALRLVRDGLRVVPPRTWVGVRLRSAEAALAARLGLGDEAWEALRQLQAEYERLPAEEIGESSFGVSAVFLDHALGSVLARLGELNQAKEHIGVVIDYYRSGAGPMRRPTRLAGAQFDMGHILLAQRRPDEATAYAGQALATDRMIAPVLQWARSFEAALTDRYPDLAEAREFRERYLALEAASQPPAES